MAEGLKEELALAGRRDLTAQDDRETPGGVAVPPDELARAVDEVVDWIGVEFLLGGWFYERLC